MRIKGEPVGRVKDKEVLFYDLESDSGVHARLTNFGATLVSLSLPLPDQHKGTERREINLGFDDLEGYLANPAFFGVSVGPVANRISNAKFSLDGKTYSLEANDGKHSLHSGLQAGFAFKVWDTKTYESADAIGLEFSITRQDGDGGFPGTQTIIAGYWLSRDGQLILTYQASTEQTAVLNLTNHAYWNLAGEGNTDILGHEMQIFADHYLQVDKTLVPTGILVDLDSDPAMDFRKPKPIGRDIQDTEAGYDHCYVLNSGSPFWTPPAGNFVPELNAALEAGKGARAAALVRFQDLEMEVYTDQKAVQFYSSNMLNGVEGRNGIHHKPRTAFCLETGGFNDAVNHEDFPSWVIEPGDDYRRITVFKFKGF